MQIAPDNFAGRQAYGQALLELNETDEAIKQLEAGVALADRQPELHFMLARAYQKAGRRPTRRRSAIRSRDLDTKARAKNQGSQSVGGVGAPSPHPLRRSANERSPQASLASATTSSRRASGPRP